jgi:hypothetical protein
MRVELYLDDFRLVPHFWKQEGRFTGWEAEYYGHTWAFTINWLWFELMVYGTKDNDGNNYIDH